MSFTEIDTRNALLFALPRGNLSTINRLHQKYPHLISHCEYETRKADPRNDYFYPPVLEGRAIVTSVKLTKTLCEKISCNAASKDGPCKPTDVTTNYFVGDDGRVDRSCEPACYNLLQNPVRNEDGEEVPHMTRLRYHNDKCVLVPSAATWSEMPLYRSGEIFETRVNDLAVGFNYMENKFNNSGLGYRYNESYCKAFFDQWDPQRETCTTPWYELLVNVVVGEALVKLTRSGIHALQNNGNTVPRPPNLPINAPPPDPKWFLNNWLKDIDTNFVLPDPDLTLTNFNTTPQRTDTFVLSEDVIEFDAGEILNSFLDDLEQFLRDNLLLSSILIDIGLDAILSGIKRLSKQSIARIIPALTRFLTESITRPFFVNIFRVTLRTTLTRMVLQVTIKVASQFMVALARMLVLASSVVGIILIIISLFDIALTFWDPLNFGRKYPPEILPDMMFQGEAALRRELDTLTPELTFDMLNIILSTEDELIAEALELFEWVFEYFNALEVNSDGRRITRGNLIVLGPPQFDEPNARINIPTLADFHRFEEKMSNRLEMNRNLNILGITILGVSLLLFLITTKIIALLLLVCSVIILGMASVNLDDDTILNNIPRFEF